MGCDVNNPDQVRIVFQGSDTSTTMNMSQWKKQIANSMAGKEFGYYGVFSDKDCQFRNITMLVKTSLKVPMKWSCENPTSLMTKRNNLLYTRTRRMLQY